MQQESPGPIDTQALGVSTPIATVRQGDAYDLLPSLEAASVDLLITSPPYWGHRTYEQDHNWNILKDWLGTEDGAAGNVIDAIGRRLSALWPGVVL